MENPKKQQVLQSIIQKAWEDTDFKSQLLKNPIPVIEAFTGEKVKLTKGQQLVIVDQTAQDIIYFNIPAIPDFNDIELNEEQLEAVAGGGVPSTFPMASYEVPSIF